LANPARNWMFAETATTDQRQTFLLMLNPGPHTARVTARFYGPTGKMLGAKRLIVDSAKRVTVRLNGLFSGARISTVINSDEPVVVEQTEYARAPNNADFNGNSFEAPLP
jgi:hypothetical protein